MDCRFLRQQKEIVMDEQIEQLVQQAKTGNEDAVRSLMEQTENYAFFVARGFVRNDDDAQEITQRAYIKAFQSIASLEDASKFQSWLLAIVNRTALNYLDEAHQKHDVSFTALDGQDEEGNAVSYDAADEKIESQPELKLDAQEKQKIIRSILDGLPEKQRTVVMMYFFEDKKISEIAEELGTNENTVKSRLNYAKSYIKEKTEEYQKKEDIKLYNITPLAFFLLLLRDTKDEIGTVSGTASAKVLEESAVKNVIQKSGISAAKSTEASASASTADAGKAPAESVKDAVSQKSAADAETAKSAAETVSEKAASSETAVKAASAGKATGLASLSMPVKIGIAAVLVFGGIGIGAATSKNKTEGTAAETSEPAETASAAAETETPKYDNLTYDQSNSFGLDVSPDQTGEYLIEKRTSTVYDGYQGMDITDTYMHYSDGQTNPDYGITMAEGGEDGSLTVMRSADRYEYDDQGRLTKDGSKSLSTDFFGEKDTYSDDGSKCVAFAYSGDFWTNGYCYTNVQKDSNGLIASMATDDGNETETFEYYSDGKIYRMIHRHLTSGNNGTLTYTRTTVYLYGTVEQAQELFDKNAAKGQLTLKVDAVNVRESPSINAAVVESLTSAQIGFTFGAVTYFETADADGYTWVRVAYSGADDVTAGTFLPVTAGWIAMNPDWEDMVPVTDMVTDEMMNY
jgi:RNA polymerase sigma factor (sigma-70 family)